MRRKRRNTSPKLAALLWRALVRQHMEMQRLAEIVECDYSYVHKIVKGGRIPAPDMLERIMEALEMPEGERKAARADAGAVPALTGVPAVEQVTAEPGTPEYYCQRILAALEQAGVILQSSEDLFARLLPAVRVVVARWKEGDPGVLAQYVPSHGPEHNCQMIEQLCRKAVDQLKNLGDDELRCLFYAVWLHDIGLCDLTFLKDEAERLKVLENYQTRSVKYLDANCHSMHVSEDDDLQVVRTLCKHHRNIEHLSELPIPAKRALPTPGQQQALIALLRLAALFEVRHERVTEGKLLPFTNQLPPDLEGELLRNLFVREITVAENTLYAVLYYPENAPESALKVLAQRIRHDLQGALHLIKHVLVIEAECDLLLVATKSTSVRVDPGMEWQINQALKLVSTSRSPNASRVMETLLAALDDYIRDAGSGPEVALARIQGELDACGRLRFYQAHVLNIRAALNKVLGMPGISPEATLKAVQEVVDDFRKRAGQALVAIRKVSRGLFREKTRFFLFGYSNCALEALAALEPAVRAESEIVVFECHAKSHHGIDGSLEYSDGLEFARKIREQYAENVNLKDFAKVTLIFDGGAAAAMATPDPRQSYLLLGAEGIYIDGSVASTIGTMPIVLAAALHGVAVYVLADGNKVREDIPQTGVRDNLWLTGDKATLRALEDFDITLGNLVNERVPAEYIKGIITEAAAGEPLTPGEIKRKYPAAAKKAGDAKRGVVTS